MRGDGSVREAMWCQKVGHRGVVTEKFMVDDDVRMEMSGSTLTWRVAAKIEQEWHQGMCASDGNVIVFGMNVRNNEMKCSKPNTVCISVRLCRKHTY